MAQPMKQNAQSKGDFICRRNKRFESLALLRKHQEFLCAIIMRRKLRELYESIEETNVKNRTQHYTDLREWRIEKARGVPEVSNSKGDRC